MKDEPDPLTTSRLTIKLPSKIKEKLNCIQKHFCVATLKPNYSPSSQAHLSGLANFAGISPKSPGAAVCTHVDPHMHKTPWPK